MPLKKRYASTQGWKKTVKEPFLERFVCVTYFLNPLLCLWPLPPSPNGVFSHDVTAAILVSRNNKTAAMLVSQTNSVGVVSKNTFIECFYSHDKQLCKCIGTNERFYIGKKVQLQQDWFGAQTWPPFYCFETQIWPPWRHVKTLSALTWSASMHIYWNKRNFYIRKRFNSHRIGRFKAISELLQASISKRG